MTQQWTKADRIQRMNKRIQQLNHYIDDHINNTDNNYHQDQPTRQPPINALKAESDLLRRIAEEYGDIPRSQPEQPDTKPIDIQINGIDATQL